MKINAIPITQQGVKFWLGRVSLREIEGRYRIDQQSPENPEGYQREISKTHAKKFGDFMEKVGVSPNTLLVNIREPDKIQEHNGYIEIDDRVDWWIVDGQHRIEGLKIKVEEGCVSLRDIELPIILMNLSQIEEAKNFLIINKMQKGVRTDLAERIVAILVEREGRESVYPRNLPIEVWKSEAVQLVDLLTTSPESPLKDMIKRPGERGFKPLK